MENINNRFSLHQDMFIRNMILKRGAPGRGICPVFKPGNLLICLDEHFQQGYAVRCLQADKINAF
ncbi:MAG: hypothetical protein V2I47_08130, partial [Bacteroidales bacterium]|nr:hypothetical protein [Bacteroidales bacterium]